MIRSFPVSVLVALLLLAGCAQKHKQEFTVRAEGHILPYLAAFVLPWIPAASRDEVQAQLVGPPEQFNYRVDVRTETEIPNISGIVPPHKKLEAKHVSSAVW